MPKGEKTKRPPPKPAKPTYDVVWNRKSERHDVFINGRLIGFRRIKGGAEAIGDRASQLRCAACGEPLAAKDGTEIAFQATQ